jgi:hypothetical protein
MVRLFERLQNIEGERNLDWIKVEGAEKKSGKKSSKSLSRAGARKRGGQKRKKKQKK